MDNFNNEFNNFSNQGQKAKNFFTGPKIIFIILGVIILAEVVYAVKVLSSPSPALLPADKKIIVKAEGKISLTTPKKAYAVNDAIPVSVTVNSGGHNLDGADLIVRFDPKILEASSGSLIKGQIFDEYPLLSADTQSAMISVSGVNSTGAGFNGTGQFVTFNFKAKTKGRTSLIIDYVKNSTSDSNLVEKETSKDVLGNVDNLELNIQ